MFCGILHQDNYSRVALTLIGSMPQKNKLTDRVKYIDLKREQSLKQKADSNAISHPFYIEDRISSTSDTADALLKRSFQPKNIYAIMKR
jgi:hypothetical protein